MSWEDAAQVAVDEAKKTLHKIHGKEVTNMTVTVDDNTGKILQYRAHLINYIFYYLFLTDNKVSGHFPSGIVNCVSQGCQ